MPVPFGFGVGDFIAVIRLITRVGKALKESGGAASEYQDMIQELEYLQIILTHLGTVRFPDVASTKPAVRLTLLISACQHPLEEFLNRIAHFNNSLNANSQRGISRKAPRKAQWGAFMGEEIPKLRAVVAAKVMQVQLVLQLYITESSIDTDSRTTKTHSLLLKYRSETQTQLETVEKTIKGIQGSVNELAKTQKSSSAVLEDKLDQVEGELSSLQKPNVEACEQWCSIKGSVEATKQVVDEGKKTQKASSEALEKKMDAATEKVTSRLSLLERCQTHYFPTLISYARSIKKISQSNSNRLQEVQNCQRTYFPRILFAIQATLVKFDDLLDLGAQLVKVSQSVPAEIRGLLKMLCERNDEVYSILKRIQRQQTVSSPPETSAQDSIHFEDVLGRTETLPYVYFRHWQVFEAYLRMRFEGVPGQDNVRDGTYHILLNTTQQQIVRKDDYEGTVFPGTKITMSMILALIKTLAQYCPTPGCNTRGTRISESSSFYKCRECNLLFAPLEPEVPRVTTLPKSQNKPNAHLRDTKVPARNRSETASQGQREEPSKRRKEPKNTTTQQHQRNGQGASDMGARENAQGKELHELRVFKRVHILPVQIDRTEVRGWVAEVLGQNRQKTCLERPMLPGGGSACYGKGDIRSIKDDLKGYDMVWDSRSNHSVEFVDQEFRFKLFIRPEDARAKILVVDKYNTDCLPLTSLLQERDGSMITLHGPNSSQVWAAIEFPVYEDLVLFYCCFEALKARDRSEIATSIGACQVPGEENVFHGIILNRHVGSAILRVFKDTASPGVRLQASEVSNEFPVWTAFVTHTVYSSTWMMKTGPRRVLLAELQRLVFLSRNITGQYSLKFEEEGDALGFVEAIKNLRGT